jgi:hypothetical protein
MHLAAFRSTRGTGLGEDICRIIHVDVAGCAIWQRSYFEHRPLESLADVKGGGGVGRSMEQRNGCTSPIPPERWPLGMAPPNLNRATEALILLSSNASFSTQRAARDAWRCVLEARDVCPGV